MSEEWRPVVGQEGFYEVSSAGRVRSIDRVFVRGDGRRQGRRGRVLRQSPTGRGYASVVLRFGQRATVHSLVCEAFHGPRPAGAEVAHWDGDKSNNDVSNLRWATKRENAADSVRLGVSPLTRGEGGERNGRAVLSWSEVDEMRRLHAKGRTQASLVSDFAVSKSQVQNIVRQKSWRDEWRP